MTFIPTIFNNYVAFAGIILFSFLKVNAQTDLGTVQPKYKQVIVYIPKIKPKRIPVINNDALITDSLNNIIVDLNIKFQNLLFRNNQKDTLISKTEQKILVEQQMNNDLQKRVDNYRIQLSQTEQSNRILIVFNSIVGVFLLFTLFRQFLKTNKNKSVVAKKIKPSITMPPPRLNNVAVQNSFGKKLQQLERLSHLKENRILTDEEFNSQKQLLLK